MEKYIQEISESIRNLRVADHIVYVTYPIIKDKRLIIKALESIYFSITHSINAILWYDHEWKRLTLSKDSKENFQFFLSKSSKNANIGNEEKEQIVELFTLIKIHKQSSMEFTRKEKIVILSDNLKTSLIDLERIKKYLNLSKLMIERARAYTLPL